MIHSNTLVWLRNINNSRGKNVYNKSIMWKKTTTKKTQQHSF